MSFSRKNFVLNFESAIVMFALYECLKVKLHRVVKVCSQSQKEDNLFLLTNNSVVLVVQYFY